MADMTFAIAWIAAAIMFALADAIWLSLAGPYLYRPLIGDLLRLDVHWPAAFTFYVLYVTGIAYFAIAPALSRGRLLAALANGAALGLVAYGTYDLTNLATLRGWDLQVAAPDMAWGSFASALAAAAGYWAARRFSG